MLTRAERQLAGLEPGKLFEPVTQEEKIGLAVSGGPDSLALLVLYAHWRDKTAVPPAIVYTVDHQLRPEAAAETRLVERVAGEFGFPVRVLHWREDKPATGIPAAARAARYRLIDAAMREDGTSILMTAHHLDDQAETVLMRLAHGSGARGLAGMRPFSKVEGVRIFRPLLGVKKADLRAIVNARGLTSVDDPTNSDLTYERARWRALCPTLDRAGLTAERLAQFAARMDRLDALASRVADDVWRTAVRLDAFGVVHIPRGVIANPLEEVRVRVLSRALRHVGRYDRIGLSEVEALCKRLSLDGAGTETLAGAVVSPREDTVLIYREAGRAGLPVSQVEAGGTIVWDGRFTINAARPVTVAPASGLTREIYKDLLGKAPEIPIAALRTAPIVTDGEGRVLALGTHSFDSSVTVDHIVLT